MAANTICTASNGWKMRPMIESDYTFFMEAFADYPLGSTSYKMRQNKFSGCIYNNSLYADSIIKSGAVEQSDGVGAQGVIRTYVTERPDGKAIHIRILIMHQPNLLVVRSYSMHPTYRGNNYAHQCAALGVGLNREWNITMVRAWLEATPTFPAINPMRTKYNAAGISLDISTDTNLVDHGDSSTIKKLEANETQYEALKTNCPGWADVTYTISTS
tara:strand:+ start:7351 stop:7998 length:648 start_codon:yes stop_codon:yes gene_type:complete